ncbi:Uncharacterized protein SCF082_LOCUS13557, partial [Durusdinium trenchii]
EWILASQVFEDSSVTFCPTQAFEECRYDSAEKCLFNDNQDCYTPPLQLLAVYLEQLLDTFAVLYRLVEDLPATCSQSVNNVTCSSLGPGCEWVPQNGNAVTEIIRADGSEELASEVQQLTVAAGTASRAQVHQVKSQVADFDRQVITLSLTPRDVGLIDRGVSFFVLRYDDDITDRLDVQIPAAELERELKALPALRRGVSVEVREATSQTGGIVTSWEIEFASETQALRLALEDVAIVLTVGDAFVGPGVTLTRHRPNLQQVSLSSNGPLQTGEFALRYTVPMAQPPWECISLTTAPLPFDASVAQIRDALLDLEQAGRQALTFVAVEEVQAGSDFADDTLILINTTQVRHAWKIVFVSSAVEDVAQGEQYEYEFAEHALEALFLDACLACTALTVAGAEPGETQIAMETQVLVEAPRMHGFVVPELCRFTSALPGLAVPVVGSSTVSFVETTAQDNLSDLVAPGDLVRIAGSVFSVDRATRISLTLDQRFQGTLLQQSIPGYVAHKCSYRAAQGGSLLNINANGPDLAEAFEALLESPVTASLVDTNALGERTWEVTFLAPPNEHDPVRFTPAPQERERLLGEGASVHSELLQSGLGTLGGSFRLAFSGYDGNSDSYADMLPGFGLSNPSADTWGLWQDKDASRKVYYTRLIPFNASDVAIKQALEEMPNIITGGIKVSGRPFSSNEGLNGHEWDISFDTASTAMLSLFPVAKLEQLNADLPPLALADMSLLSGTDAQVGLTTLQDGAGRLFQSNQSVITEVAVDPRDSPCTVNATYREEQIFELGIEPEKIEALRELDSNFERCATGFNESTLWNSRQDCGEVKFAPGSGGEDGSGSSSLAGDLAAFERGAFCAWRGETDNDEFVPPNVDPQTVFDFNWANVSYGGATARVRNGNCTIPLIYKSQQLLKIFGLSEAFIESYEVNNATWKETDPIDVALNSNRSAQLSGYIEQFNRCFEDLETVIQVPAPRFVRLWQEIVTFTCYTVGVVYGAAGLVFTYRMRTFKLLSPKSIGSGIVIVFSSMLLGGVIGFVVGAIPAAIIFNLYSAIPHNLPQSSAISLGVAQGLLILYFDTGRGLRDRAAELG